MRPHRRRRLPKNKNRNCTRWMLTVRCQSSRLVLGRCLLKKCRSCTRWMLTVRCQSSRLLQPGALHVPARAVHPRQQPRLGFLPSSSEPWRHRPPLRSASGTRQPSTQIDLRLIPCRNCSGTGGSLQGPSCATMEAGSFGFDVSDDEEEPEDWQGGKVVDDHHTVWLPPASPIGNVVIGGRRSSAGMQNCSNRFGNRCKFPPEPCVLRTFGNDR